MAVSAVRKESPKAPAPQPAAAPAAAPRPKRRWWLYALLGVVLLGGAGGGAWWWFAGHGDKAAEAAKPVPPKPPVFLALETFTVNLQQQDHAQFVQVGLTLRLANEATTENVKRYMPEIRDRVLLLLSAKRAAELLTVDGKRKLATEIQTTINALLVPGSDKPAPAKRKPAPAADAAPAAASADAAVESAQPAAPAAEPAPAPAPAPELPVTGVLFTSFIVQ